MSAQIVIRRGRTTCHTESAREKALSQHFHFQGAIFLFPLSLLSLGHFLILFSLSVISVRLYGGHLQADLTAFWPRGSRIRWCHVCTCSRVSFGHVSVDIRILYIVSRLHIDLNFSYISIKTRIQVQAKHEQLDEKEQEHYTSAWDGIKQILDKEGLSGLYAGLGSSLIGTASTNFTYFYCYSLVRNAYNKRYNPSGGTLSTAMELILGALAGAMTTLVTTPVSVVTTRQQTLPSNERQGVLSTCATIVQEEGIAGLWRGIRPSLILCVNPAITYGSFEKVKQFVTEVLKLPLTPGVNFVVGALSKTLATIVTYPYIMAKVRLQWKPSKDIENKVVAYKSAGDVLARVLKSEGFFGWYKVRRRRKKKIHPHHVKIL